MKTTNTILLFSVLTIACSTDKQKSNFNNIKKVRLGMDATTVRGIMGESDFEYQVVKDKNTFNYSYYSEFGSSDNYFIFFSISDSCVTAIGMGE